MLEIERALLVDIIHKHTTKNNKNLFKELESHKEKEAKREKEKGEREVRDSLDQTWQKGKWAKEILKE